MLIKKILIFSVLTGLTLVIFSCQPTILSSDAGVYQNGQLYAVASQDLTSAYKATLKALEQLELKPTENIKDVFSAKVVAKGADGKVITVKIKPGVDDRTDFTIKVGMFGDKHRSHVIYEQIKKNL